MYLPPERPRPQGSIKEVTDGFLVGVGSYGIGLLTYSLDHNGATEVSNPYFKLHGQPLHTPNFGNHHWPAPFEYHVNDGLGALGTAGFIYGALSLSGKVENKNKRIAISTIGAFAVHEMYKISPLSNRDSADMLAIGIGALLFPLILANISNFTHPKRRR